MLKRASIAINSVITRFYHDFFKLRFAKNAKAKLQQLEHYNELDNVC